MSTEIEQAARDVAAEWDALNGDQRRGVNDYAGRGLYKALHALGVKIEAANADHAHGVTVDEGVNRSPGVTGCGATPEALGYPAEKRVADLEQFLDRRHVRENALHHARKLWVLDYTHSDVHTVASEVTTLAQAFEQYLTDGTVHGVPVNPNRSDDA